MRTLRLERPHIPAPHSYEWSTPISVFDSLDREFNFTIDVCASADNAKCARFYALEADGLRQSWAGETVWCNPPYGRGVIDRWVEKAYQETAGSRRTVVVMLLPNNTDSGWWHRYCVHAEVRFLRGRLSFGGLHGRTRFGSAIAIFRGAR